MGVEDAVRALAEPQPQWLDGRLRWQPSLNAFFQKTHVRPLRCLVFSGDGVSLYPEPFNATSRQVIQMDNLR